MSIDPHQPASAAPLGPTRRQLLRAGPAAALAGTLACRRAPDADPGRARGVLLLVADDLGRRDLGLLGNRALATPAIDGLGLAGVRLDRAYTTTALCRPSRASILSGLYPHNTGRSWYGDMRADLKLWPEHFGAGGVVTGTFGKTSLSGKESRWDFSEGGRLGYEPGRDPATFGDATRRFLELTDGRPFAFVVNFFDPHRTDVAARQDPGRMTASRAELERIVPPPNLPEVDELEVELRNYHHDVERMDAGVAAVLAALDERGLAGSTLVAFTSDNGADFPFAKGTLYEAGVNLPLLVRWPDRVRAGGRSDALVSFVDLLPTFMEALGLAPPAELDGRSLLGLLTGRIDRHREAVFCEHDEHRGETAVPSRAVIEARYKYVRHFRLETPFENASMRTVSWRALLEAARGDPALAARVERLIRRPPCELFDLEADPWELQDRAGDPTLAAVEARLAERLRGWMRAEGDAFLAEWDA